jgi:8-hydroxy-5-deazaflavin:NADPH oxidoreductase
MGLPVIAVIGGTGKLGMALAYRLLRAGYPVSIGSRNPSNAQSVAADLGSKTRAEVRSGGNRDMAALADIIIVTVPFTAQLSTLAEIREAATGKLLVDTTVPLMPPKVMRVDLPAEGSAAQRAAAALDPSTRVVSAFHNVAAHKLATAVPIECDVLVFGDDKESRGRVVEICAAIGLRGLHGGALGNSAAAEALTSVLIFINKHYAVDGAGIRITGELKETAA